MIYYLFYRILAPANNYKIFTVYPIIIILIPFMSIQFQAGNINGLFITEVFYSTPGKDIDQEWVEIANLGENLVALHEIKIGDEEIVWGGEGMLRFPEGTYIQPGQVIIVAQSAVGFRGLYGRDPDYEIRDSIAEVPNMEPYKLWSSGDFALANDGDELLLLDENNLHIDVINYGDQQTFFSPSIGNVFEGQSIERIPAFCDSDTAADWQPQRFPTPGKIQSDGECAPLFDARVGETDFLTIGEIQGHGDVSPFINQEVAFRGVVTGFQEDRNADGIIFYSLFVQSVPGEEDGDPATSDGIVLFLGQKKPSYQSGSVIYVSGKVTEFFGLTEIDDEGLQISAQSEQQIFPEPILLEPAGSNSEKVEYYETLEGMLVQISHAAVVSGPTHSGCGFDVFDSLAERTIIPIRSNDDPPGPLISILHQSDVDCSEIPQVKTGDSIQGLVGPLTYHFDRYKIVQQNFDNLKISVIDYPAVFAAPIIEDNQISVASFNIANYFDEKRDTLNVAEPIISEEQRALKRKKLVHVMTEVLNCPTVLALQEVENRDLLQELADNLQPHCLFRYQINHQDGPDSRGLDVAMLTDPNEVQILGEYVHQICTDLETGIVDNSVACPDGKSPLFGRPPLQLDAKINGQTFQFIVVHLKSKRGDAVESENRRIAQAHYLNQIVRENIMANPLSSVFVLGDFNDYEQSPTTQAIASGDLLQNALIKVPLNRRYSYIFDGQPQLIDGIFVSQNIEQQITFVDIFHVNANFPVGLEFDTSVEGLRFHSSDHDIPFIVVNVTAEEIVFGEIDPDKTPESYSPQLNNEEAIDVSEDGVITDPLERLDKRDEPIVENNRLGIIGGGLFFLISGSLLLFFILKRR